MSLSLTKEWVQTVSEQVTPSATYTLQCLHCGKLIRDDGTILTCPSFHEPSFLRTVYSKKRLAVKDNGNGIYKFSDWLPINRQLRGSSAPITFKSVNLARQLGMENLYITFNGYWPERDVYMLTGTFKECEAFTVCARLPKNFDDIFVLASTGNTARAFARVCSDNHIKLILVVPEYLNNMLWFKEELYPTVKLVAMGDNGDYYDAMRLADHISTLDGFTAEGGAKNVARRDGMGTSVLSAVTTIGRIPDFYFQAIGSGAGSIAAWEQSLRLAQSGVYGSNKMKVIIAQNYPFIPIVNSWRNQSRKLLLDEENARRQIAEIKAKVLANRNPTYTITGGVYDTLMGTEGDALSVTNEEAMGASKLFESEEGIDILPPAAVSTAALIQHLKAGAVKKSDTVMLHITGGGIKRFKRENHLYYLKPSMVVTKNETSGKPLREKLLNLFD